jgi:DNA-binding transcriptional regulator YiaG
MRQQGVCGQNTNQLRFRLAKPINPAMTGSEALSIIATFGRSKAEVARLLGVSPVALQKWKQGGSPAQGTETLLRLLKERPELLEVLERIKRK